MDQQTAFSLQIQAKAQALGIELVGVTTPDPLAESTSPWLYPMDWRRPAAMPSLFVNPSNIEEEPA